MKKAIKENILNNSTLREYMPKAKYLISKKDNRQFYLINFDSVGFI